MINQLRKKFQTNLVGLSLREVGLLRSNTTKIGLVYEAMLNGNSVDTAGQSIVATDSNMTYSATDKGYNNTCGVFNGTSSRVSIANNAALNMASGDFTICCWVKTTQTANTVIYRKDNSISGTRAFYGLSIELNGGIYKALVETWRSTHRKIYTNTAINDGNWHFILGLRNGGLIEMYMDGILQNSASFAVLNVTGSTPSNASIGRESQSSGSWFGGSIQGLRIYNRALIQKEINELYAEGLALLH